MRFNHLFASQFGSCRLLKKGHDPHRNRDVRIYALPGEFEIVGMTDGVDCWVAPVATGFLEDVRKLLARIRAGEDVRAVEDDRPPARRRINVSEGQSPTGRMTTAQPEIQNLPGAPTAKLEMAPSRRRININL